MTSNDRGALQDEYPTCQSLRRRCGGEGLGCRRTFGRTIVPGIAENIRCVVAEMRSAIHTRLQPLLADFVGRGTLFGAPLPFQLIT